MTAVSSYLGQDEVWDLDDEQWLTAVLAEIRRGWNQGALYDAKTGDVCLLGAASVVVLNTGAVPGEHPVGEALAWQRTSALLWKIIAEQYPDRVAALLEGHDEWNKWLIEFNDHDETELADVVAVLEKAIVKAGEGK